MTLNRFLEAIAAKLTDLWPDRLVHVDQIPRDADGNFFVGIVESEQAKRLDRRRRRAIQFEILYFLKSNDIIDFNDWAEAMYDNFEAIVVQETEDKTREIRLTNTRARRDDAEQVFQFLLDASFDFVLAPEPIPYMESLEQKGELK